MTKFIFADSPLTFKHADKADPQKIGEALRQVAERNGGELDVDKAIEAARARNSPLHRHLEWDDKAAADGFRREQMRSIIRCIRIVGEEEQRPRAFLSIADESGHRSYRQLADVQRSTELQLAVLRQAERDLDAFMRRYRDIQDICEMVRPAKDTLASRIDAAKPAPKPGAAVSA